MDAHRCDIRDAAASLTVVRGAQPEIVFHLAAQPLVRASYATRSKPTRPTSWAPSTCWKRFASSRASRRRHRHQRQVLREPRDRPAATAKTNRSAVTIRTAAARPARNWSPPPTANLSSRGKRCRARHRPRRQRDRRRRLGRGPAHARPDARLGRRASPLVIRHPAAVRPWQHVLEPLAGYLRLAERLTWQAPFAERMEFWSQPTR